MPCARGCEAALACTTKVDTLLNIAAILYQAKEKEENGTFGGTGRVTQRHVSWMIWSRKERRRKNGMDILRRRNRDPEVKVGYFPEVGSPAEHAQSSPIALHLVSRHEKSQKHSKRR